MKRRLTNCGGGGFRIRALLLIVLVAAAALIPGGVSDAPAALVTGSFAIYAAPAGMGDLAGEPSIGVNPKTGNVMFQAFTETLRVTFDDSTSPAEATWDSVAPLQTSITNNDPILYTDTLTGRTWAGGLNGQCSVLAATDDDGVTWMPVGNACASPSFDHEKIGSGPWRNNKPAHATYDRAFYYCAHMIVEQCAVSYDGGLTFTAGVPINPTFVCAGLFGNVRVGTDGRVYVPPRSCIGGGEERAGVIVSETNGLTWLAPRLVPDSTRAADGFNPSVAPAPGGGIYLAWEGEDGLPYVAFSSSGGRFWTTPVEITGGTGITRATFLSAIAGDADRVAVAYLATKDGGQPFDAAFTGTWDLYVSFSTDGGQSWVTEKATSDPVQRGWICNDGAGCPIATDGTQPGRNLLDFIDATLDTSGRVLVAFADGCIDACVAGGDTDDSQASKATIARQVAGPCLIAGGCGDATGTPVPPRFNDQCDSNVIIFSGHSPVNRGLNPHAAACLVAGANPGVDTTFLLPASDVVSVRYAADAGSPTLTARLDGLGLVDHRVTLTRSGTGAALAYNSPLVTIDRMESGLLRAIVYDGATELDRITYRTMT